MIPYGPYGGFHKWGYPQSSSIYRCIFHHKPSSLPIFCHGFVRWVVRFCAGRGWIGEQPLVHRGAFDGSIRAWAPFPPGTGGNSNFLYIGRLIFHFQMRPGSLGLRTGPETIWNRTTRLLFFPQDALCFKLFFSVAQDPLPCRSDEMKMPPEGSGMKELGVRKRQVQREEAKEER